MVRKGLSDLPPPQTTPTGREAGGYDKGVGGEMMDEDGKVGKCAECGLDTERDYLASFGMQWVCLSCRGNLAEELADLRELKARLAQQLEGK